MVLHGATTSSELSGSRCVRKSHAVVLEVYKLTKRLPKEELFGLVSQMRRQMNIAQGDRLEEVARMLDS
jgi:four helix bundle protein